MVLPPPIPQKAAKSVKKPTLPSKMPTKKKTTKSASKTAASSEQSCLRRNWCWVVRIILALVGIGIPLYMMFLMPCTGATNYVRQPVDMFVILDASGSVSDIDWTRSTESASEWVRVFDEMNQDMQVGVSQFSDDAFLNSQFHPDVNVSLEVLSGLPRELVGGTAYVPALTLLQSSLNSHRQPDSFAMALFISDGEPNERDEDIFPIVDQLKADNVTIVGVMIGSDGTASQTMYQISSCELYDDASTCPNFIYMDNFQEFQDDSRTLANSVALQVGLTEEVSCEPGLWWLSLLLLLPLLLVLCVPCCVKKQKKKLKRKYKAPDVENPRPTPPTVPDQPKRVPTNAKKQKYKWEVKNADHYLWTFAGGTTPMAVDYGKKAPPSAPKDLSKGKFKRKAEAWEEADGYCYEYEVEDCTLEEWAEEKISEAAKNGVRGLLAACCCCCFCCKKNSDSN